MKIKKKIFFFELLPFANLDIENLISQTPLQLAQLIEDKEKITW